MQPLTISNVSKTFKTKTGPVNALNNISLAIEEGEIFGLLGPNGAGKSTLINIMLHLLLPDTGEVRILGQKPGPEVLRQINIVAGGSAFHWNSTPNDILNFYSKIYGIDKPAQRIQELASLLRIEPLMNRKFSWFSTGERLRVAFAKALLNKPKLLLMDEPTLGLDPDVARTVRKEVQRLNKEESTTILLTSHYMHEVEQLCSRIAFIYKGSIVDIGRVKDVKLKHFGTYELIAKLNKKPSVKFLNEHSLKLNRTTIRATLSEEDELTTILASIHEAGYSILDIEVKKPTLEDYFIKISEEQ